MIITTLDNLHRYYQLNKNLDRAIKFLLNAKWDDLLALPSGKTDIDQDLYLLRQSYQGISEEEAIWEYHEKYLDIQLILSGNELFGYLDASSAKALTTIAPFNDAKDICKLKGQATNLICLSPKQMTIVFPEDYHLPKIKVNDGLIEKLVLKVKLK